MDRHELALKTYEDLQKRKKLREMKHKQDLASVGWNGYNKFRYKQQKVYYNK